MMLKNSCHWILRKRTTRCIERGDNRQGAAIDIDVPAAEAYCQVDSSDEEGEDVEVADHICVQQIVEKESNRK